MKTSFTPPPPSISEVLTKEINSQKAKLNALRHTSINSVSAQCIAFKFICAMIFFSFSGTAQNTFPNNGPVGIGTLSPQYSLDVNGSARISGNLFVGGGIVTTQTLNASSKINAGEIQVGTNLNVFGTSTMGGLNLSSMTGVGNFEVLVNSFGQFYKGSKKEVTECVPNAPQWFIGGNNVIPLINNQQTGLTAGDIGTCDNTDFVLKANNIRRQWIKPDGSVTFGTLIGSNSNGPEYRFKSGVIRLQDMNSFGGPQIIFDGQVNPYGDWGIEYLPSTNTNTPGLNFWKPSGSPNSFNYLMFIGDDGRVTVGANNELNSARFNVDGWNGAGIRSMVFAPQKAFIAKDKNDGERFVVWGNGNTHMGINNQIGFTNPQILNTQTSLLINDQNIDGIKFLATNANAKQLNVMLNDIPTSKFVVYGDGRTRIGDELPINSPVPYMLTVNGKMGAREIKVSIKNPWPDYVFKKKFELSSLEEKENYTNKNHHLMNMPSAKELESEELSLDLGEMQTKTVQQIEEIYLHLYALSKEVKELKKENESLKKKIKN